MKDGPSEYSSARTSVSAITAALLLEYTERPGNFFEPFTPPILLILITWPDLFINGISDLVISARPKTFTSKVCLKDSY